MSKQNKKKSPCKTQLEKYILLNSVTINKMNLIVLLTFSFLFFSSGKGEAPVKKKCTELKDLVISFNSLT